MLGFAVLSVYAQDNAPASPYTMRALAKLDGEASGLAISSDGTMIFTGGGSFVSPDGSQPSHPDSITIWDAETGDMIRQLPSDATYVADIVLTPDGNQIVAALTDNSVGIWDVQTGELVRQVDGIKSTKLDISPDGQMVISSQRDGHPTIWNFQTGEIIYKFAEGIGAYGPVSFSPDGKIIAVVAAAKGADKSSLIMWDTETDSEVYRLEDLSTGIEDSDFSPDGQFLALATQDQGILVIDVDTGEIIHDFENDQTALTKYPFAADGVSFSADGRQLLSSWVPNLVLLLDSETGVSTYVGSLGSKGYHVAFTPDGIPVSTAYDGTVDMWIPKD